MHPSRGRCFASCSVTRRDGVIGSVRHYIQMNLSVLLTVEERFVIDRLGIVVAPDFPIPRCSWNPSEETVTIRRPDGSELEAVAQFNHSHFNIPDPTVPIDRRWRVTVCILKHREGRRSDCSRLLVETSLSTSCWTRRSNNPMHLSPRRCLTNFRDITFGR